MNSYKITTASLTGNEVADIRQDGCKAGVQTHGPGNDRSPVSARACEHALRSRHRQAVRGEDEPGGPHVTPEFPLFHVAEDHEALTRAAEQAASLFGQGERLLFLQMADV